MIKILQIMGEINGGGVGAVVYNYLSHMNRKGMEIDILAYETDGGEKQFQEDSFRELGCRVYFLPHRNRGYREHFARYRRLVRDGGYDIVHCHFEVWSAPYLAIARAEGVKIRIAHCHIAVSEYSGMKAALLKLMRLPLYLETTDPFACGREAGAYLWGKKPFYTMNNAVDTEAFRYNSKVREKKRGELRIPEDTVLIGCVGRLSDQKNPLYTVEIAKALADRQADFKLIMIGDGELYAEVERLLWEKGLEERVLLMGLKKDIPEWMQAMDVFILPSKYEGLPVVAVEAQAAGLDTLLSEKITPEAKMLDSTEFLSIDRDAGFWAERILERRRPGHEADRAKGAEEAARRGFDIQTESEKLRRYYLNRYFEERGSASPDGRKGSGRKRTGGF